MRKFYFLIILIGMFPFSVRALTLECPEVATQGEEIVCSIFEQEMIGLKVKYDVDSVFTYLGFQGNDFWKNYYIGAKGFAVGNINGEEDFSGNVSFRIGMDAVSGREYKIRLVNIEGVNVENQNILINEVFDTVRIVSDVNTLNKLEIVNATLNPKFSSTITSYQTSVKEESVEIRAELDDYRAKLEGDIGVQTLKYGVNPFSIRVISERGNIREYHIFVTRVLKNKDATLKSLMINGEKIKLEKDKFYYDLEVENEVVSLDIEANKNHELSKIEIKKPEELIVGENVVTIKITAEDGTECTYVINVFRKKVLSSNNLIQSLMIKGYDLNFSKDCYFYELIISDEEKLDIDVLLESEFASYIISGNQDLKNNSKIDIVVKAENGDKRTYTIKVVREGEANSNSIFSSIRLIPLISFIILILLVLIIKKIRSRFLKLDNYDE